MAKPTTTTKLIGLKEFRANITSIWKKARKYNIRFIVMNHSTPIMEVSPIMDADVALEKLAADVKEAREQFKRGEFYTQEEVFKHLGIK